MTPAVSLITGSHLINTGQTPVPSSTYAVPQFVVMPQKCFFGALQLQLLEEISGTQITPPSYVSLSGTCIIVTTDDVALEGVHTFIVVATVPTNAFLASAVTGSVVVKISFN